LWEEAKGGRAVSPPEPPKKYDLEERTFLFAKRARAFVKRLPRTISNIEDGRQLVKSSGSVGANYIEANEALSKKDFLVRIKISRKESKESRYGYDSWRREVIPPLTRTQGTDPGKYGADEHFRRHPAEVRMSLEHCFF